MGKKEMQQTGCGCLIVIIIIITCIFAFQSCINKKKAPAKVGQPKTIESNGENSTNKTDSSAIEKQTYKIFDNAQDFQNKFNTIAHKNSIDFSITSLDIKYGTKKDIFTYSFNDNISLLGTLNKKDKTVRTIVINASGDGTYKTGTDIFDIIVILIKTSDPNLSNGEISNLIKDLELDGKVAEYEQHEKIKNNIRYSEEYTQKMGLFFSISNASDKK